MKENRVYDYRFGYFFVNFKLITCLLILISFERHAKANIWVFDINDTITLKNDVDPQKTEAVVLNQLVAQNIFLTDGVTSIESHIKSSIIDKAAQRETYGTLSYYAQKLFDENTIDRITLDSIEPSIETYKAAWNNAKKEFGGLFPSFYKMIDFILKNDQTPTIIFQSFGEEIPMALENISNYIVLRGYQGLTVNPDVGFLSKDFKLTINSKTYNTPAEIKSFLQPGIFMGWKNEYDGGGRKLMFFDTDSCGNKTLKTFFFDDNADRFASVSLNGEILPIEYGYDFAKEFILKVDTGKALLDENYFIDFMYI